MILFSQKLREERVKEGGGTRGEERSEGGAQTQMFPQTQASV